MTTPETGDSRAARLRWARDRALEHADAGDTGSAITSLVQDLGLHPETASSVDVVINLMMELQSARIMINPFDYRDMYRWDINQTGWAFKDRVPLAMMGDFERPGELRKFIEGLN